MIDVIIDGKKLQVAEGTTILEAAQKLGIDIPTLCHNEMLPPYGVCRVCVVEVVQEGPEGPRSGVVTACKGRITRPVEIQTGSQKAQQARRHAIGKLLSRWPNVQVLKDLAIEHGVDLAPAPHPKQNPDEHACVLCGRCIRMCRDGVWHNVLDFEGKGDDRQVVFVKPTEQCVGCGACQAVCPTGAIRMEDDPNHPADPQRVRRAGMVVTREVVMLDKHQNRMRDVGTATLVKHMDDYDLLPVHNFKFGSHPEADKLKDHHLTERYFKQGMADSCALGCDLNCSKTVQGFELKTGPRKGEFVVVDGPEYETTGGCGSNMGIFDLDWVLEMNFYCDDYGIDTISFATAMAFVMECYEAGILNKQRTGGLELNFGAAEDSLTVLHQMGRGKGFGLTVGLGIRRMKKLFADKYGADPRFLFDIGMENKGLEYSEYVTKESLAQQGGYGISLKGAQHDEAWLIFMDMVNKQLPTFEDKAEALHYMPMWRTWFGLNGLCKLPWNDVEPADNAETDEPHKVPVHVQGYCDFFSGVTGREVKSRDLIEMSERVYNLQRIFNLRQGFGTRKHDAIAYRSAGPVTEEEYLSREDRYDKQLREEVGLDPEKMTLKQKMAATRKHRTDRYEKLLDAVYKRRGWTNDGIPTIEKVRKLGIDKVEGLVELLEKHLAPKATKKKKPVKKKATKKKKPAKKKATKRKKPAKKKATKKKKPAKKKATKKKPANKKKARGKK